MRKQILGYGGLLLVIAGLIYALNWVLQQRDPAMRSVEATPAPELKGTESAPVVIKAPVKTYAAKKKLNLPASVQADEKQQVIAASRVAGNDRPSTVTTVINSDTGAVTSYTKQEPFPWFAIEARGEARVAYGMKIDSLGRTQPVARLAVSYDVLRVKAITGGVVGMVDSDGSAFVGVGLAYRW